MKKLIPLLLIGAFGTANAQVIILESDFPTAGTTFMMANDRAVPAGLDLGTASATPQTFDFTMLETDTLTNVEFHDPATVDLAGDFPNADIALDQFGGYAFAEIGASEVQITGIAADFGAAFGLPVPFEASVLADDPWTIFEFPSQYGSVLTDTAEFNFKLDSDGLVPPEYSQFWDPDSIHIKRIVYMEAEVDAEGTLNNVLGESHQVLRQNIIETNIDSIWGWTAAGGWEEPNPIVSALIGVPATDVVYRMRYISKTMGYYVVEIETDPQGVPTSASFKSDQSQCCTGVEEIAASGQNVLYPNPTNDFVRVKTGGDIYELQIMDMSGKLLVSEVLTNDNQVVQLDGLANGLYVYQMISEEGRVAHTGRLSCIH